MDQLIKETSQLSSGNVMLPELTDLHIGHLRHIIRLSRQAPGDWSDMGPFDPTNEGDDAYRYQLAYMAYTLAVIQQHYVPGNRELLRSTFQNLITKMLRHDVWAYWELTSKGSKVMDPDLETLVEGWADPVSAKNIMYSGHLLMMVSLYEMLYRDGYYAQEGSLTFECRPPFRGLGPQDFVYSHHSLAKVIAEQFEQSHGMGCECEPNGIFVYCNQFPLLGLMSYDHVYGTDLARPLMKKFKAAWSEKSNLFSSTNQDDLPVFYAVRQDEVISEGAEDNKEAASVISWGPLLHVWEPEYIEGLYPDVVSKMRVPSESGYKVGLETFHRTHIEYQKNPSMDLVDPMMLGVHTHGMFGLLAAELGDEQTRDGLLAHADAKMNPRWKEGGLFYPRCDDLDTENYVTCVMGNALIGATRIVPKNGISNLFNNPWTENELNIPLISGLEYPEAIVSSAHFSEDVFTASIVSLSESPQIISFRVIQLPQFQNLTVNINGESVALDQQNNKGGTAVILDEESRELQFHLNVDKAAKIEVHIN